MGSTDKAMILQTGQGAADVDSAGAEEVGNVADVHHALRHKAPYLVLLGGDRL